MIEDRMRIALLAGLPALECGRRAESWDVSWLDEPVPGVAKRKMTIQIPDEARDRLVAVARKLGTTLELATMEAVVLGQDAPMRMEN